MKEKEDKLNKLFGIDKELLEKSKDIKPILELGKMKENESIEIEFLESFPREVSTPNSKFKKVSNVIFVRTLNDKMECSLFLSAKSLSLGVAKLWENNNSDLMNVKAIIKKTMVSYKEYGENNCYNVQQLKD